MEIQPLIQCCTLTSSRTSVKRLQPYCVRVAKWAKRHEMLERVSGPHYLPSLLVRFERKMARATGQACSQLSIIVITVRMWIPIRHATLVRLIDILPRKSNCKGATLTVLHKENRKILNDLLYCRSGSNEVVKLIVLFLIQRFLGIEIDFRYNNVGNWHFSLIAHEITVTTTCHARKTNFTGRNTRSLD